jgi:hypothetical protein
MNMPWVIVQRQLDQYQPGATLELSDAMIASMPPGVVRVIDSPAPPEPKKTARELERENP